MCSSRKSGKMLVPCNFVSELARVGLGIVLMLVDFLKWSKFMVIRTFSKILTHSVLFEVHRLWLAVVS